MTSTDEHAAPEPDAVPVATVTSEPPAPHAKRSRRQIVEWVVVIGGAIVIAVVIRTFVLQTFWIPSGSMEPTLANGDRIVVNKLSYRLHDVRRGDVVVFDRPANLGPSYPKDFVKRVVGLPGDHVSITDGVVHIDGKVLPEPYIHGKVTTPQVSCPITSPLTGIGTTEGVTIPKGSVLLLGDNRTDSTDGRCFGTIPVDRIVGRASVLIWPLGRVGTL
ncbi:signal peptidase I [Aquihabitans sp. McL0605]|uniref:signal peptidase I n=1 Tax=Aquihabitans sp. McL0605 TaxID=3415671 RepID=UPI003CE98DB1